MSNLGCELRKLPLRQRKFLKAYLETGNVTASAISVGYEEKYGFEILRSPTMQFAFQAYLDKSGIDDSAIQSKLKELLEAKKIQNCNIVLKRDEDGKLKVQNTDDFLEVPDGHVQVKALELAVKLKGHLRDGNNINIDTGDKTIVYVRPGGGQVERIGVTPRRGNRGNGKSPTEPSSPVLRNPGEGFPASPTVKQ